MTGRATLEWLWMQPSGPRWPMGVDVVRDIAGDRHDVALRHVDKAQGATMGYHASSAAAVVGEVAWG